MSAVSKLIGEKVIKCTPDTKEVLTSVLEGREKVLGLYFSAHWCPPCRAFTPQLTQWYNNVKKSSNGEKFDIVFLSSDRDEAQFNEYFKLMPWYAVPYGDRDLKNKASRKFKVTGIPTLVLINAESGDVITTDGRSVVMDDPDGKEFPWSPKPVLELLSGILKTPHEDTTWDIVQKDVEYVGIYFSAHWCGPCRTFTPELVKTYNKVKDAGKKFEVIFCSSDREEDAYKEYYATMPWLALPFGDNRKKSLSRIFHVNGIPTLVILDKEGKLVNSSGRVAIKIDPDGKDYPWKPKPVNMLSNLNVNDINENAAIVWFTDGSPENLALARKCMETVALECKAKPDPDYNILFFYTDPKEEEDIIQSLRSFARLPAKTPLLAVLDIPRGKQYVSDADKIIEATVREMVKGFREQSLEGQHLS